MRKALIKMGNQKDEMISMIEGMLEDMVALSCDSFEFVKVSYYSMFRTEAEKYLVRNMIDIAEKKRPLMIEMKR